MCKLHQFVLAFVCFAASAGAQTFDLDSETFGLGPKTNRQVDETTADFGETFGLDPLPSMAPRETSSSTGVSRSRPARAAAKLPPPSEASTATRRIAAAPYTSPPGYHRHVLIDGTVIEHGDWNYGDPVAHSGVAGAGWPKYFGPVAPGAVATAATQRVTYYTVGATTSTCPGGVCPTSTVRPRFFRRGR